MYPGKFKMKSKGGNVIGKIEITAGGYGFVVSDTMEEDIFIFFFPGTQQSGQCIDYPSKCPSKRENDSRKEIYGSGYKERKFFTMGNCDCLGKHFPKKEYERSHNGNGNPFPLKTYQGNTEGGSKC